MPNDFSKWINNKVEGNYYTPDMPEIYALDKHFLFVYGKMKFKEYRHDLVENEEYIGKAYTKYATYGIINHTNPSDHTTPYAFRDYKSALPSFIKGELYCVNTDTLLEIDYVFSNNVKTQRIKMPVVLARSHEDCTAWCYLVHPSIEFELMNKSTYSKYLRRSFLWNTPVIDWQESA